MSSDYDWSSCSTIRIGDNYCHVTSEEYLPASDLLLIPGVTSFVPFWWPVLALIFALVIHEYSHGIHKSAWHACA